MKFKLLSIIIGIIIVGTSAYFFMRSSGTGENSAPFNIGSFFGNQEAKPPAGGLASTDSSEPVTDNQLPVNNLTPQTSSSGDYAKLLRDQGKIYENFDVMFNFLYPPDFTIDEIDDERGLTILAQNSAKKAAFQIFLNPFDEPAFVETSAGKARTLTPARIKKDLPNMVIENPQQVLIGANKNTPALIFFSQDQTLGKTREIWFVGNGHLFQVETFADQDSLIGPVMDTWQFIQ